MSARVPFAKVATCRSGPRYSPSAKANRRSFGPKFVYQLALTISSNSSASSAGLGKLGRIKGISAGIEPPVPNFAERRGDTRADPAIRCRFADSAIAPQRPTVEDRVIIASRRRGPKLVNAGHQPLQPAPPFAMELE